MRNSDSPLNDEHTLICRGTMHFAAPAGAEENCVAFLRRRWRRHLRHPMSDSGAKNQHRENKMKQLLKMTLAPAAALFTLALVATATPASANPNEYCRLDYTSSMRNCSFSTLEQCQAMTAGRGGTCYRDPFLATASSAYAWQPKAIHSKKRIENR
jgi:hypothetical protein